MCASAGTVLNWSTEGVNGVTGDANAVRDVGGIRPAGALGLFAVADFRAHAALLAAHFSSSRTAASAGHKLAPVGLP